MDKCDICHGTGETDDYNDTNANTSKCWKCHGTGKAGGTGQYGAAHGFHGMIYKPTHFLVGEKGKERVDITPMKKRKNNIFDAGEYFGGFEY